jgi:hypothetical protein
MGPRGAHVPTTRSFVKLVIELPPTCCCKAKGADARNFATTFIELCERVRRPG